MTPPTHLPNHSVNQSPSHSFRHSLGHSPTQPGTHSLMQVWYSLITDSVKNSPSEKLIQNQTLTKPDNQSVIEAHSHLPIQTLTHPLGHSLIVPDTHTDTYLPSKKFNHPPSQTLAMEVNQCLSQCTSQWESPYLRNKWHTMWTSKWPWNKLLYASSWWYHKAVNMSVSHGNGQHWVNGQITSVHIYPWPTCGLQTVHTNCTIVWLSSLDIWSALQGYINQAWPEVDLPYPALTLY